MSSDQDRQSNLEGPAAPAAERKPWHRPKLSSYSAVSAGTKAPGGIIDGGGGAHRSS